MSENRMKLLAACVAAHAALESLMLELAEPEQEPPGAQVPPSPPTAASCPHEHKRELRTFGVAEHWVCDDCGLEFRR